MLPFDVSTRLIFQRAENDLVYCNNTEHGEQTSPPHSQDFTTHSKQKQEVNVFCQHAALQGDFSMGQFNPTLHCL